MLAAAIVQAAAIVRDNADIDFDFFSSFSSDSSKTMLDTFGQRSLTHYVI